MQKAGEATVPKKEHTAKKEKETMWLAHTSAKPKEIHHSTPQQPVVCSVARYQFILLFHLSFVFSFFLSFFLTFIIFVLFNCFFHISFSYLFYF